MGIDLGPYWIYMGIGIALILVALRLTYTIPFDDPKSFSIPLIVVGLGVLGICTGIAMLIQQVPPCISSSGLCW